jgi:hypothetical protein
VKSLFLTAHQLETFIRSKGWNFCFIGGIALQRWGRPRLTADLDLTIITGFGGEEKFIQELLNQYEGRREDTLEFALRTRVLLLRDKNSGIGIDISLGALFFEEGTVSRASLFEALPNISITTCSAEDLIILKAFANRLQDWADIEGVLEKNFDNLDYSYIDSQLIPLLELKEEPEIHTKLIKLINSIEDLR